MEIPMLKIRRSRDRLIFNMGIPILVRQHLYIETPPRSLCVSCGNDSNHNATVCYKWYVSPNMVVWYPDEANPLITDLGANLNPCRAEFFWTNIKTYSHLHHILVIVIQASWLGAIHSKWRQGYLHYPGLISWLVTQETRASTAMVLIKWV